MTSFSQAQREGKPWPLGPDDLRPGKQENYFLYAGGRTGRLKYTLAGIWGATGVGITLLDKYLVQTRSVPKPALEKGIQVATRLWVPTAMLLFFAIPTSQAIYWFVNLKAVGVTPLARDALPNWKPGEGILDNQG